MKYSTSMAASFASIKGANRGKVLIIDEDNNSNTTMADIKRFSLYQYALNDKGKEVLIKHGGALPLVVDKLRKKVLHKYSAGVPQYWKLTIGSGFTGCCENYSIRFGLYNDVIQKTMFPSELVETYSTENECCGLGCGNGDAYDNIDVAFRIWADVAYKNYMSEGYVSAWLLDASGNVIADNTGHISNSDSSVTADISDFHNGMIGSETVADFITSLSLSGNVSLVFGIAAEPESHYSSMNFKYDVIRNTVARVTLNGGFKCAEGLTLISNNDSTNGTAIKIDTAYTAAANTDSVGAFAYAFGSGYDVHEMELADSLHTLNSPYTLSDITLSENGIAYRTNKSYNYDILNIEYQQPSDGVTRVEDHPWGTTIAIKTGGTTTNWLDFAKLITGNSSLTWVDFNY